MGVLDCRWCEGAACIGREYRAWSNGAHAGPLSTGGWLPRNVSLGDCTLSNGAQAMSTTGCATAIISHGNRLLDGQLPSWSFNAHSLIVSIDFILRETISIPAATGASWPVPPSSSSGRVCWKNLVEVNWAEIDSKDKVWVNVSLRLERQCQCFPCCPWLVVGPLLDSLLVVTVTVCTVWFFQLNVCSADNWCCCLLSSSQVGCRGERLLLLLLLCLLKRVGR